MVNEREPPKPPAPAANDGGTPRISQRPVVPEFGQPSPLGPTSFNYDRHPFNIPKQNRPRPEHHRSAQVTQPQQRNHNPPEFRTSTAAPTQPRPYDPFRPMKPSEYTSFRAKQANLSDDESVVEILRPANATWTTKPAPTQMFASAPKVQKTSNSLKSFIDLTTNEAGFATNSGHYGDEFGAMDAYSYVDAAKANENIKELLEGAFEDEDEKPRTRLRQKKIEDQVNALADKLKDVAVGDKKEDREDDTEDEEEDDGTVEGLKVKLLPHQIDGVNWMRDKETGLKKTRGVLPKGGILADDMGLGKTVQSIALMLTNPRPSKEAESKDAEGRKAKAKKLPSDVVKGTLVVAPLALIKQWEAEIEDKIEYSHRLRVCVYHGAGRTKHGNDLKDFDVIITTYGTLSSEHGNSTKKGSNVGLFNVHWYRIILDEAHMIKNRNAKATQAVYGLDSEYRWCLTGTPMQNNLDELQSLIKFLRIKPYNDLAAWRDQITRPLNNGRGGLAIRRLQVYLKAFMKRRTKDVLKLDGNLNGGKSEGGEEGGKPSSGFKITKREVLKLQADFTPEERAFYTRLEQRTDKSLEQMMGGQSLNYASALVLLLRLRQACNHPDLVKGDLAQDKDVLTGNVGNGQSKGGKEEDVDSITNLLGGLSVVTKRCDVCQIELDRKEAAKGASRCAECDSDLQAVATSPLKEKKKKKKKKKDRKSKARLSTEHASESQRARARRNRLVVLDSDDEEDAEWIVPDNERSATDLGKAGGVDDEDAEGGGDWLGSDDSETEDEDEEDSEEEEEDDEEDLESHQASHGVMASTKIRHLMKILKHEAPDFKFIVFSFFTSMLDKIEPFLKDSNIGYARYDGGMRNDHREQSLDQLRNSKKTRVLLCSLRAGSLGLNLTAASRVVILEPFWNPFVEEQAIDRVHRLNQTIDVKIYKMTVKDTVEERIVELQDRKRELANATIEGKTAAAKLTMKDMMALFGHDAEARFVDDAASSIDLVGRTRLLDSRNDDDTSARSSRSGSAAVSSASSASQQARRATPPVMERKSGGNRRPTPESSVYGRRW
ncbi:hypothetical protein AJ80_06472 [Polytolypa hystricis UAMH7299]|uniref:Helicase ATP-binding domain-containing protein n=1 Tax=Polytolypa hystricis (strain UAMH7299) TaxID=1447883 RepID=A0A2B7XVR2_POLH7|nr:hypothetical protein AJ80_06472 [Polytolypa hystricis UAMH7299]